MRLNWPGYLVVGAMAALAGGCATTAQGGEPDSVILDTKSFWRWRTVWETPELVLPSGEVKHARVHAKGAYYWFQKNPAQGHLPESHYKIQDVSMVRLPAETAADWMKPDFDDSTWARLRGPMLGGSNSESWKLILMRGAFEVKDPAKVADLTLSLAFRGGAVVYLNGEEEARAFMRKGELDLYTAAEPYPEGVYFTAKGFTLFRRARTPDGRRRIKERVRRLTDCKIPAARLRKGLNVLAIAIHRAPTPAKFYVSRPEGYGAMHDDCYWAKIGLRDVRLVAPAGAAVVPNTSAPKRRGFPGVEPQHHPQGLPGGLHRPVRAAEAHPPDRGQERHVCGSGGSRRREAHQGAQGRRR